MLLKLFRRGSTRCLALLGALLTAVVCLYYISLANQTSANVNTSQEDAQQQKLFRNVLAHDSATSFPQLLSHRESKSHEIQTCPAILKQRSAMVDTAEQYQKFDFQPAWMKTKEYWDDSFEKRYELSKKDANRKGLKVILVPHSHNDPGWLKTFEHYFESDTKNILNQLVNKMRQYKQMTFIWSEISFLQAWWDQVHPTKQKAFRKYVESGRLEITTGGWVMTDEANVHLYAMWDQLVEGHQWVKRHLNVTPVTGWSIDPFGHGSTFPYILSNSGVKGAIVQRLHYAWKQWLAARQYGDFLWVTGWENGVNNGEEDRKKRESNDEKDTGNGLEYGKRVKRNLEGDDIALGQHSIGLNEDGSVKLIKKEVHESSLGSDFVGYINTKIEDAMKSDAVYSSSSKIVPQETKMKKRVPGKKRRKMKKHRQEKDNLMQEETVQYAYVSKNGKLRSDTEVSYEVRIRRSADDGNTLSRYKRSTKPKNSILTHNMPFDIYSIKHSCGPHPYTCLNFDFRKIKGEYTEYSIKAQNIDSSNIQSKAELLLEQYSRAASLYPHNVALVPIGDDFRYNHEVEFDQQYTNYKLLVDYINRNQETYGVDISFGTPKDYFEEINRRITDFPTLTGDFFVYSDIFTEGRPAYWSGYFTTRPFLKILGRKLEHNLRNAEILFTVTSNYARQHNRHDELRLLEKRYEVLVKARRNLALFQHHDAITGTSKYAVMRDYGLKLFQSLQNTIKIQQHAIEILLMDSTENVRNFILNDLERESYNKLERKVPILINKNQRQIVLFNSLPQERSEVVQIRVNTTKIVILDANRKEVRLQVNPVWNISDDGKWNISDKEYEIMFLAKIPPLTLLTYTMVPKTFGDPKKFAVIYCRDCKSGKVPFDIRPMQQGDVQIENTNLKLLFDGRSGFLKTITKKSILRSVQCALKFAAYPSAQFHSGAYLFKPDPNSLEPEKDVLSAYSEDVKILITSGPIASELTVNYGAFLTHTMRIYNMKNDSLSQGVYMENLVDFEQPPKNRETELFMRFQTDIENGDPPVFYSDSNGFQYQKRTKVADIGIEGNYFPITAMTFIQDEKLRLSLLTDHAQGAASFEPGQLEVMLDRRTLYDDSRGMGEGLVDNRPTLFRHWIALETVGRTSGDKRHDYRQKRSIIIEDPQSEIETKPLSQQRTDNQLNNEDDDAQQTDQEYQLPSLFAAQLADALNYPVNLFTVEEANGSSASYDSGKEPSGKPVTVSATKSRVSLISHALPCDMRLVNLRTMTDVTYPQFPASSALMMMHRQGYTCSVGQDVSHHCTTSQVHSDTNFLKLKVSGVTQVTLTGIEDIRNLPSGLGQIYIEPMDLQTVRVDFQD